MKQTDFLHIIPSLGPKTGGPAAELQELIPALEARGISNEVACSSISGTKITEGPKVPVHEFAALEPFYRFSPALCLWGIKNISRFKVIIIHGLWQFPTYCFLLWMVFFCFLKKPFPVCYIKVHGNLDPWFQKSSTRRVKAIRNFVVWIFLERWVVNNCEGLLFGCKKELFLARKTFPFYRPKNEIVVGYYVNPAPKRNEKLIKMFRRISSLKEKQPYLLFLSRIDAKKGLHLLIPAYSDVLKRGNTLPVLVMAGPGWESPYGEKVQAMASAMLPKGSYRVIDSLFGELKWAAFYGCQAFILPSQQENFGIAVVEALSCNKPVIISKSINIWEKIKANNAAFIFSPTEKSISKCLEKLCNISRCSPIGFLNFFKDNPRNCFRNSFAPDLVIKSYISLVS